MYPVLQLKAGREASVGFHHPWVFSGAIETFPADLRPGVLVHIADRNGVVIGTGTYGKGTIAVRIFDFREVVIDEAWMVTTLRKAYEQRQLLGYGKGSEMTGYRLVHGEGDHLPGLVIDMFDEVAVMQISTAGMDVLRPLLLTALQAVVSPKVIFEKSDMQVRAQEELVDVIKLHVGTLPEEVTFTEAGLTYLADVAEGQKTGFFLDQKDLRAFLTRFADQKKVLNLFSYTGATSAALLRHGAAHVHNVDESSRALELLGRQMELTEVPPDRFSVEKADVFQWVGQRREETYDMVLLDPPALAKTKREKEAALKAYHFLNRSAMKLVQKGGLFVTSSCSHYISEEDLLFVLRRASVQAGVELRLLSALRQSPDHPWSIYFPEGLYLKSFVFTVN